MTFLFPNGTEWIHTAKTGIHTVFKTMACVILSATCSRLLLLGVYWTSQGTCAVWKVVIIRDTDSCHILLRSNGRFQANLG